MFHKEEMRDIIDIMDVDNAINEKKGREEQIAELMARMQSTR